MKSFKSMLFGGLLGVGLIALLAASYTQPYYGIFYGDGSNLTGISGSGLTNNQTTATVFSNTLAVDAAHQFIASNLTSGRVLVGRADSGITNSSASGAVPVDADGTAATFAQVQALGPLIVTNGNANDVTMSNFFRVDAAHSLSLSNATASRMAIFSADKVLTNAGASGAVPIDADGSAATFAQVQALGPLIVTNGNANDVTMSNFFRVDIGHSLSLSNLTASRMLISSADKVVTNAGASGAVPINADGSATTWAQIQALVTQILTNNYASGNAAILLSNFTKIDITHSLSLSNLTASRMLIDSADNVVTNVGASGAVPINADGSATTMAQVSALGTIATTSLPIVSFTIMGFSDNETFIQATANYMRPSGGTQTGAGSTTESQVATSIFQQGYFTNLWWNQNGIGTSTNVTITLMTNGVASNLASTIVGTGSTVNGFDSTHGVPLTGASNNCSVRFTSTNPSVSAAQRVNWSVRFVSYP